MLLCICAYALAMGWPGAERRPLPCAVLRSGITIRVWAYALRGTEIVYGAPRRASGGSEAVSEAGNVVEEGREREGARKEERKGEDEKRARCLLQAYRAIR